MAHERHTPNTYGIRKIRQFKLPVPPAARSIRVGVWLRKKEALLGQYGHGAIRSDPYGIDTQPFVLFPPELLLPDAPPETNDLAASDPTHSAQKAEGAGTPSPGPGRKKKRGLLSPNSANGMIY